LVERRDVSASTQKQALNALVFLYAQVLHQPFGELEAFPRAKRPKRLPAVLARSEVEALLGAMDGTLALMAGLLYGSGLRLMECVRLRTKDIDFELGQVMVRDGKGQKDRLTMLPERYREPLRTHLERVRDLHARDLGKGFGEVWMPPALARKYPSAGRDWRWQYVFPSQQLSVDPRSGTVRRHHASERPLQRSVADAARRAGLANPSPPTPCATLRHPLARSRLRHPHRAGTARPLRRLDDDDLYSRPEQAGAGGQEPGRPGLNFQKQKGRPHRHRDGGQPLSWD
jgi:integron integrase